MKDSEYQYRSSRDSSEGLSPQSFSSVEPDILSAEKLVLSEDTITDVSSEFLDLPKRLSGRTSPSLYRLRQSLEASSSSQHSLVWGTESYKHNPRGSPSEVNPIGLSPNHRDDLINRLPESSQDCSSDIDITVTSNVDIVIESSVDGNDDEEGDEGRMEETVRVTSNLILDNQTFPGSSLMWNSLEPQSHTLLSPRSSNGSICSFRSSNADSAIDMLTPDDIQDMNMHSDPQLWESRREFQEHSSPWETSSRGVKNSNPNQFERSRSWSSPVFTDTRTSLSPRQSQSNDVFHMDLFRDVDLPQYDSPIPSTPSVVISDYSSVSHGDGKFVTEDKSSQTGDMTDVSSYNLPDNLDINYLSFQRGEGFGGSTSSISSIESILTSPSLQSDSSLDVEDYVESDSRERKVRGVS